MTEVKEKAAPRRNIIDRVVEYVAPSLAIKRAAAREAMSSYRGAVAGRFGQSFSTSTSYKNGTRLDRKNQASMCDRGRQAYRENVVAKALLDAETDYIIGDGFTLQMRATNPDGSPAKAFNDEAERRFYKWLDKADVTGKHSGLDLQRMSWRETRKDGDGGLLKITRGGYPYLQYIPRDLIRDPIKSFDYRTTIDGITVDPSGRPVTFHIRDIDENGKDTSQPVEARDFEYIAHLDSPLAVRGTTAFAPIFAQLDQLDTYVDSVTKAAILGTIFGLQLKVKNPAAHVSGLLSEANQSSQQQLAVKYEGGMMKVMGTDEGMYQVDAKQPMQQTPDFIRAIARIAALGFDMPLEIAFRDVSQVNFSGGRIGLLGFYRSCRIKQFRARKAWEAITFWWLSVERKRKALGYPDAFENDFPDNYGEFDLHGREYESNDRRAEAEADLLEFSMGKPMQKIFAERGWDYEDGINQWAAHIEKLRSLGLPVLLSTSTRDEAPPATADMQPAPSQLGTP